MQTQQHASARANANANGETGRRCTRLGHRRSGSSRRLGREEVPGDYPVAARAAGSAPCANADTYPASASLATHSTAPIADPDANAIANASASSSAHARCRAPLIRGIYIPVQSHAVAPKVTVSCVVALGMYGVVGPPSP